MATVESVVTRTLRRMLVVHLMTAWSLRQHRVPHDNDGDEDQQHDGSRLHD
jgi:hypothetical protein